MPSLSWILVVPLVAVVATGPMLGSERATLSRVAHASACGDSASITWEPRTPRRGALFRIRVSGVTRGTHLEGRAGTEALHFVADSADAALESLAPVPIDGPDALQVVLRCGIEAATDTMLARVPTADGRYAIEKLRVAPAFGRPPDSATAARIERESARALAVAAGAHATPRLWRAAFRVPRETRITSGFGQGREFNGTITSRHMGTDFAGTTGEPVRAVNRGVVRIVAAFYYGGNVVYVDHGAGLTSAYLHLSRQEVAAGDTVERGQQVGRVGATGRVTGPHLHLIVRYGGVTVDPVSLFATAGDQAALRR